MDRAYLVCMLRTNLTTNAFSAKVKAFNLPLIMIMRGIQGEV